MIGQRGGQDDGSYSTTAPHIEPFSESVKGLEAGKTVILTEFTLADGGVRPLYAVKLSDYQVQMST